MRNKKAIFCFILFILIDVVSMRGILGNTSQLAYGDFSPFPQTSAQVLDDIRFAWRPISLGMYRDPVNFQSVFQWLFLLVFQSPVIAQKVYIFILPIIAYLSFLAFVKYLYKGLPLRYPHAFIVGLLYAFSPVMLSEFIGGTLYSTMLIFSFFPLIYLLSMKIILESKLFNIVALGLLLGGLASIYPHLFVIYSLSLIVPSILHLWFYGFKRTVILWLRFIPVAMVAALTNPIFFLSVFSIISPVNSNGGASAFVNSIDTFIKDIHYTYTWSTFFNVIRLGNNYTPLGYTNINLWTIAFYLPVFISFLYSVKNIKQLFRNKQLFVLTCVLSWIFIVFGIYLIHLHALDYVFKSLPVLFLFRNPAKLTALATFFFTVVLYKSILDIETYKLKKAIYKLLLGLIFVSIVINMWPIFTYDRGLSVARSDSLIPEYYYEIAPLLVDGALDYRVMWLPASHETTSIKLVWLSRNNVEAQSGLANFSDSNFSPSLVTNLLDGISMENKNLINNALNISQVKYVVVLKGVPNGAAIANTLSYLTTVATTDKYVIYENTTVYPKVMLNPNISLYSNDSYAAPSAVVPNALNGFINLNDSKKIIDPNELPNLRNYFVTARKTSKPLDTTKYYWESNHWSWPSARIALDDPRHFLVKAKESLSLMLTRDSIRKMESLMWLAAKRIAEVRAYPEVNISYRLGAIDDAYYKLSEINKILRSSAAQKGSSDYYSFINKYTKYLERMYFQLGNSADYEYDLPIFSVYADLVALLDTSFSDPKCLDFCYKVTPEFSGKYNLLSDEPKLKINASSNLDSPKPLDFGWLDYGVTTVSESGAQQAINIQRESFPNLIDPQTWYDQNLSFGEEDLVFDSQSFAPAGSIVKFQKIKDWKANTSYDISFDYNLKDGVFGYAVIEKLDTASALAMPNTRPYGYVVSDTLTLDFDQGIFDSTVLNEMFCSKIEGTRCYFKYSKTFTSTNISKEGYLIVFNYAKKSSISQNKIFNLKINKVVDPLIFLKQDRTTFALPQSLPDTTKINPSLYKVNLSSLNGDSLLVFNESYNQGWKLVDSQGVSLDLPHFKISGYANAWLVKQDTIPTPGTIYIKFMYQDYVDLSIRLTLFTYGVGLLSLIVLRIKKW